MKVTDLDALSPNSSASPPDFLDYAWHGAKEIASQMSDNGEVNKEKSFTDKISEDWELAKEKVSGTWDQIGKKTAISSQERVNNMQGKEEFTPSASNLEVNSGNSSTYNQMNLGHTESESSSTHTLESTTMGDDGKEHHLLSTYSVKEVPLPGGKVEVREKWVDREDNKTPKIKKETKVVDADALAAV